MKPTQVIVLGLAALATPAAAKKKQGLILDAKFDGSTADTVEDAAWNCIIDFANANPDDVCSQKLITGNLQPFADMCSLGNLLLFDKLHYLYCNERNIKKKGKYFHPGKRPYLKKPKTTVTTTVVNVNIIEATYSEPTTVTLKTKHKPYATVTVDKPPPPPTGVASIKPPLPSTKKPHAVTKTKTQSTLLTVTKTVAAPSTSTSSSTQPTCKPSKERKAGEYDNGQWCIGKYEEAYEEHVESNGYGTHPDLSSSEKSHGPKKSAKEKRSFWRPWGFFQI